MKKILLLLLAFPLLGWIAAAEVPERDVFPRGNAIWNTGRPYNRDFSFWFGLVGDTVINDTTYQKLYQLKDSSLLPDALDRYVGGIRQENQRVSLRVTLSRTHKDKDKEIVLCDFSKEVGDTVYSPSVLAYGTDTHFLGFGEPYHEDIYFVIHKISMDEKGRKHVFVNQGSDEWIEGIGSTKGLFWYYLAYLTNGQTPYPHLKCMKHNDEVIYMNNQYGTCETCFCLDQLDETLYNNIEIETISLKSIASISYISGQNIRIELSEKLLDSFFELYDLSGVLLLSQSLTDQMTEFSLGKLPQGVYLYRISSPGLNAQSGKIILK